MIHCVLMEVKINTTQHYVFLLYYESQISLRKIQHYRTEMEENKKLRQSKSSLKIVLRFGQPRGDLFFITLATKEIKDINQLRIGSTLFSVEHITFLLSSLPFRLLKLLPLVYPIIYHSRLEIENLTFVRGS